MLNISLIFPALCAEIRACAPSEFLVCIHCVTLSIFIQKKMIGRFGVFFKTVMGVMICLGQGGLRSPSASSVFVKSLLKPKQIITPIWTHINPYFAKEVMNVEPWWWNPKPKPQRFGIFTCTTIWLCYGYYRGFSFGSFTHLRIHRPPPKCNQFFLILPMPPP